MLWAAMCCRRKSPRVQQVCCETWRQRVLGWKHFTHWEFGASQQVQCWCSWRVVADVAVACRYSSAVITVLFTSLHTVTLAVTLTMFHFTSQVLQPLYSLQQVACIVLWSDWLHTAFRFINGQWASCLIYGYELEYWCVEYLIFILWKLWMRSFSTRLTSVTFAEDKVLVFLILSKNAKIVQLWV